MNPPPGAIAARTFRIARADLRAWAAATGDDDPVHLDPVVALSRGLSGVPAQPGYVLALAVRYVEEWVGRPGQVRAVGARHLAPVVVPEDGTELVVAGVAEVPDGARRVSLTVTHLGARVLGGCVVDLRA